VQDTVLQHMLIYVTGPRCNPESKSFLLGKVGIWLFSDPAGRPIYN